MTMHQGQPRIYRSLFLGDGNPHQRYYGWRVVEDLPGLRVLAKSRGLIHRTLTLLSSAGAKEVSAAVERASRRFGLTDIVIHDFDNVLGETPLLAHRTFLLATGAERLLNVATFVIDLTRDERVLFEAMSSDYRRKIRRAEEAGIRVTVHDRPGQKLLSEFAAAFGAMAAERSLSAIDPAILSRMYQDGNGLLLVVQRGEDVTNYLNLYTTGDTALFMSGVNPTKENDGAGQLLHWRAIQELKARGFGWYDLGGVASLDPSNGIYKFKQKFGGQLVLLGSEWRGMSRALRPLLSVYAKVRNLRERRTGK
jgi:CelD/BcsL family acetyltransferase involved in cellulose biosynthesis